MRPSFAHLKLQRASARELLFLSFNFAKLGDRVPEAGRAGLLTALSRALDRDALIAMYLGWASPVRDRISPEPIATAPAPVAPEPTINSPAPFRAELHAANDADSRRVAGLIQTQARTAGLELNIRPVDLGGLMQGVLARQNEITLLWIEQAVPSTALFWAQFFTPGSPFAVLGQPIDGIDADVRAARSILDPTARRAAYDAVIAKISGQQSAWLSLCTRDAIYLTTPRVESLGFDSNGNATLGLVKIRGE